MNTRKDIFVFLGPSFPVEEAKKIINATFLPPAEQGDIAGIVRSSKPKIIALIDGVFLTKPSVWHKEILWALSEGIHVYGASSMGALRSAELAAFGMKGIGKIFEKFASGEFLDDDEVALTHHGYERQFMPLTEPMVNVRETFYKAQSHGIINHEQCQKLIEIAKNIYFVDRTRNAILRKAVSQDVICDTTELEEFFQTHYVDLKKNDALALLNFISQLPEDLEPFKPQFELSKNRLFETLITKDASIIEGKTKITNGDVLSYHALHDPEFEYLNFNALNRGLVMILADLLEVQVSEDEIATERKRFKLKYQLMKEDDLDQWLETNHITYEFFHNIIYQKTICRKLHHWLWLKHGRLGSQGLLTEELLLTNKYQQYLNKTLAQQELIDSFSPFYIEEEMGKEEKVQDLLKAHLKRTNLPIDQHFLPWLKEANFSGIPALEFELIKSKIAHNALSEMLKINQTNGKKDFN